MSEKMTEEETLCRLNCLEAVEDRVPGRIYGCFEDVFRYQFLEECRMWAYPPGTPPDSPSEN